MVRSTGSLRLLALSLLTCAFALSSCDATAPAPPHSSPDVAGGVSASYVDGSGRLRVHFDTQGHGQRYYRSDAEEDFGSDLSWASSNDWTSRGNLMETYSGGLRFRLPAGVHGNGTGGKIRVPISSRSGYYLQYRVQFESGFDFTPPSGGSNGGKLPGLAGGDGNTGGDPGWDGDGWSARLMWRGDRTSSSSTARLYAYVYHKDQPKTYGQYVDTGFDVSAGDWYTVRLYVGMNTGDNKDGRLRVWLKEDSSQPGFGSSRVSRSNIRWMDNGHEVDEALIQVFNGGGTSKWDLTTASFIRIDDVATCHTASECNGLL